MQGKLAPAVRREPQLDFQIGRAEMGVGAVRPFDETDAVALEILVKAGFEKLICMGESIKIKVIYGYSRIFIRFDQGVSRTFDLSGVSQAPQQAAGEGGLAGAQVAAQVDGEP